MAIANGNETSPDHPTLDPTPMTLVNHQNTSNAVKSNVGLLIVDMINAFEFDDSSALFENALHAAHQLQTLKQRFQHRGLPVIYANDNFGKWQSDFRRQVEYCLRPSVRGHPIAGLLKPDENDYFVMKPKHSAFFLTPLELLLQHLSVSRLVVTGIATDMCVMFTCNDAYMRDYQLTVPRDCVAAKTLASNDTALEFIKTNLKANILSASEVQIDGIEKPSPCS